MSCNFGKKLENSDKYQGGGEGRGKSTSASGRGDDKRSAEFISIDRVNEILRRSLTVRLPFSPIAASFKKKKC